ncbi:MAG TPA: AAA family ATPase [Candidatus Limnocylindria bacterium]|jgi:pilus assembly protein CpaE|nr:AAA family ATPase [Candidatus Limnocylindria bacterium]
MPANPILICAPTDDLRTQLEDQLAAGGYATTSVTRPAEAVAALRDKQYDLVLAEGLAVSGAIGRIRTASPVPTPILVVAPAGDVEARIAFLEAGADDVVTAGVSRQELEAKLEALLIRAGRMTPDAARSDVAEADIVTFFSPKGGVGTTTLAVNSAVLLAGALPGSGPAARVLLVDLDLQFGQVATHLNLQPRFDIAGLAGDEPALGDQEVAMSYLTPHSSGVQVLAAPAHPDADFRVTVDQLDRALATLRPRFDTVIVDCGSRLDPRSLWMLEQASTHVFVVFPEIAALRAMSVLLGFLAETATLRAKTHYVVNHIFPKELLKTRDVENLLRTKPAAEIPYTEVEMIRAVNEGVPVVTSRPGSPVAMALQKVAQAIIGIQTEAPAAPATQRRRSIFARR